jgi:FkbM family methyltransferase
MIRLLPSYILQRLLARFGLRLSWDAAWPSILDGVDSVIDVGANLGQTVSFFRSRGFNGHITCFEPNPEVIPQLVRHLQRDGNCSLHKCALGDVNGNDFLFLRQNSATTGLVPSVSDEEVTPCSVRVCRLDQFQFHGKLFLKVDTEGNDLAVLSGASGILDKVVGIMIEAPIQSRYQNEPLLPEVLEYVTGLGFRLAFVERNGWGDSRTNALYLDLVFTRHE